MISGLLGGVMAIIAWQLYKYFKEKREEQTVEEQVEENTSTPETAPTSERKPSNKEIVLDVLRKMQCEPVIDEEKDNSCTINFEYQAERFSITVDESSSFVTLYDPYWYSFDANDLKQVGAVKKIVNDINWQSQVNVCYNKTDENNMYNVHIQTSIICNPDIDFTGYLRHLLRECFVVHNHFYKLLAEANLPEKNNQ